MRRPFWRYIVLQAAGAALLIALGVQCERARDQQPEESYRGQAYYDANGWHLEGGAR